MVTHILMFSIVHATLAKVLGYSIVLRGIHKVSRVAFRHAVVIILATCWMVSHARKLCVNETCSPHMYALLQSTTSVDAHHRTTNVPRLGTLTL